MKLGPVLNLTRQLKQHQKNWRECYVKNLSRRYHFCNLWPVCSIPKVGFLTQAVKLIFSLTVAFYLTKTENRTKKSSSQLSHYYFK